MTERKLTPFEIKLARKSPKKFNQYMLDKLNAESEAEERAEKEKRIKILMDATEQDIEVSDVSAEFFTMNGRSHIVEQKCISVNGITFALLDDNAIDIEIQNLERWLMYAAGESREQVENYLEKFYAEQEKIQKMHNIAYMISRAGSEKIYMLGNPNFGTLEDELPYIIYIDRFEVAKEKKYDFAKNAVDILRYIAGSNVTYILNHLYGQSYDIFSSDEVDLYQINWI